MTVVCNHVIEHVDDKRAMSELLRILKLVDRLFSSVPIIEGGRKPINSAANMPEFGAIHFGKDSHVRFYGVDFRDQLMVAGFARIDEVTVEGQNVSDMAS